MKTILLVLCITVHIARAVDVSVARDMFLDAYGGAKNTECFYRYLHEGYLSHPVAKGYMGVSEIMMCRYISNPFSKLSYFRSGKKLLETAISENKDNAELRFLRFAIQTNAPQLLNYAANIREDKRLLLRYLHAQHEKPEERRIFKIICDYLLKSAYINEQERLSIKTFANK